MLLTPDKPAAPSAIPSSALLEAAEKNPNPGSPSPVTIVPGAAAPARRARFDPTKIRKASEVQEAWGLCMFLYGYTGSGKTTLCSTAQDDKEYGSDLFIADIEGGIASIEDRTDIDSYKPHSYEEFLELVTWIEGPDFKYRTLAVDHWTVFERMTLDHVMKTSKTPDFPSLNDYGRCNELLVRQSRRLKELSSSKGINVIICAWAREVKDESSGALIIRPALRDKAAEGLMGAVDVIGYHFKGKDEKRVLQLGQTPHIIAKFRRPLSKGPIPEQIVEPTMHDLFALRRGLPR